MIKIFLLIIFLITTTYLIYIKNQCKYLGCIDFTEIKEYKIKDIYRDEKNLYSALYIRGDNLLRVEIKSDISREESDQIIETRTTTIKSQFENSRSPYPGEISDEIVCDNKFKPVFLDGYVIAYLNSRLTYGSCIEEQNVYKSIEIWKYCEAQKKLYQLEYIYPKDKFHEDKLEISCLN